MYETAYRSILDFLSNIGGEFDLSDPREQENLAERLTLHLEQRRVLARYTNRSRCSTSRGR